MSRTNTILLGQFLPGESWLHRADPRSKLVAVLCLSGVVLYTHAWTTQWVLIGIVAAAVATARLPLRTLLLSLRPFLWFLVIIAAVHALWSSTPGRPLVNFFGLTVTDSGLAAGAFYALRLATLIVVAQLLMITTMPLDLMDGVNRLLQPLRRLRLPVGEVTMMMGLALRFIPTLFTEAERLRQAQLSRGANLEGGLWQRMRAIVPMVLPLFVSALRRADDLALAMESRCYAPGQPRSQYRELSFRSADHLLVLASLILVLVLLTLRVRGWPV